MRLIDRLYQYLDLELKGLTAYGFEHSCKISNGYLKKQSRGKGSIGSDIIEKIHEQYPDLSLLWLLTGQKPMLMPTGGDLPEQSEANEEKKDILIFAMSSCNCSGIK